MRHLFLGLTPLFILALPACLPLDGEEVPAAPAEVCWEPGASVAGLDGAGNLCPDPGSPIGYSLLGPNVKLVVDRSRSMTGDRWEALLKLSPFLPMVGARANLGLSFFPVDDACGVGEDAVPVTRGEDAAEQVAASLATTTPDGFTPLADAIAQLPLDPALQCTNRDNVVILLSDGDENCGGDPAEAAATLPQAPVPIELFVIGFSTTEATNQALREVAAAARPTSGADNFFTADTAEELVERLAAVTGTCTAQLDGDVAADALGVTLDGESLARCTEARCESGYVYDRTHGTVEIQGTDCLALQDGTCHELLFDQP